MYSEFVPFACSLQLPTEKRDSDSSPCWSRLHEGCWWPVGLFMLTGYLHLPKNHPPGRSSKHMSGGNLTFSMLQWGPDSWILAHHFYAVQLVGMHPICFKWVRSSNGGSLHQTGSGCRNCGTRFCFKPLSLTAGVGLKCWVHNVVLLI